MSNLCFITGTLKQLIFTFLLHFLLCCCTATQAEAKLAARPRFEGLDLEAWAANMDVLPLMTSSPPTPSPTTIAPIQRTPRRTSDARQNIASASGQQSASLLHASASDGGHTSVTSQPAPEPKNLSGGRGASDAEADAAEASPAAASRAQPKLLLDPVSSGQPLRARVSGSVKLALRSTGDRASTRKKLQMKGVAHLSSIS